jgi:hypothetical protein
VTACPILLSHARSRCCLAASSVMMLRGFGLPTLLAIPHVSSVRAPPSKKKKKKKKITVRGAASGRAHGAELVGCHPSPLDQGVWCKAVPEPLQGGTAAVRKSDCGAWRCEWLCAWGRAGRMPSKPT